MTATLIATGLAGGYGHTVLFEGLDLSVLPGEVIGIVGANGAGKSTLLRLLAGRDRPHNGSVVVSPSDAVVGWVPQEHERVRGETVAQFVARRAGVAQATELMEKTAAELASLSSNDQTAIEQAADRYSAALDRWMAVGGADFDERLPVVLWDLGLRTGDGASRVRPSSPMTGLSGGEAARVGLAALLLSRFDIALLDEPTNDLDIDGLSRLESFVKGQRGGVVVISHDREFLSRCVSKVVEIDSAQFSTRLYEGGYEAYLVERETARRQARDAYDDYAAKKAELVGRARMQREWTSQGVRKASKNADGDKNRKRSAVESSQNQGRKARQIESRIARLEEVEEPRKEWELRFEIGQSARSSNVVFNLTDAVFRNGTTAQDGFELGPVTLQVNSGDRIGITGHNGAGKSTLLRGLLGRAAPSAGSVARGPRLQVGEIDQTRALFEGPEPLLSKFESLLPEWSPGDLRTLAAKFGLGADHVDRRVDLLSPGERTRASMVLLQARGVNVLILDEPTNHLDLTAIEQLEHALNAYVGTLLLVTHDRRMLDRVSLNRSWEVLAGRVVER